MNFIQVALAEVLGERVLIIYFLQDHQCVPSGLMVTIWASVLKISRFINFLLCCLILPFPRSPSRGPLEFTKSYSVNSNFRAFRLVPVTRNILGYSGDVFVR